MSTQGPATFRDDQTDGPGLRPGLATQTPLSAEGVLDTLRRSLVDLGIEAGLVVAGARLREDLELDSTEIVQVSLDLTRAAGRRVKLESATDYSVEQVCQLTLAASDLQPGSEP